MTVQPSFSLISHNHNNLLLQLFPSSFRLSESSIRFVQPHRVFDPCCSSVKGRCNLLGHRAWSCGKRRAELCYAVVFRCRVGEVTGSPPRRVGKVAGSFARRIRKVAGFSRLGTWSLRFGSLGRSGRLPSLLSHLLISGNWYCWTPKLSWNTGIGGAINIHGSF